MKARWTIAITAGATLAAAWFAAGPVSHEIELRVKGESGQEALRMTRNWEWQGVLAERRLGTQLETIRAVCYGPMWNVQIHLTGLNNAPNLVSIESGVVKVTHFNLFGYVVGQEDWLNINTRYLAWGSREPLFAIDSAMMASTRAGYSGANGFYELVPP